MVIEVSPCVSRVCVTVQNFLSPSWKFLTSVITMMMMITHHSVIIIVISCLRRPELRHVERSFTFEKKGQYHHYKCSQETMNLIITG